ncbi:MAG: DUF2500 domain-containing protein [Eubacteriales bacterium]|nr:DUF2500 domain-containing protein [Eubacteriales bacterium]
MFGTGLFEFMFAAVFWVIIGFFIVTVVSGVGQWNKNNHSPKLDVEAKVVAKRTKVTQNHHAGEPALSHTSTSYYVTFEVESGDRMEFHMSGREYGMLAEQDCGKLSFQGTRYLGFERI